FELVNDRYLRLVGGRDVPGRSVREALPEVVAQGFVGLLDRVYRTGEPYAASGARVVLEAGGVAGEWYLDFVYQPLRDPTGAVTGIIVQGVDQTDRVRAEAAVRERDERLQLFLGNATGYAVVISDPDDRAIEWLGGAEQITGWRADEALGQPLAVIFTPEDRAAGVPDAETKRAAETGRAENTRWHQRKDGSRFFAEGVTVSLRGPDGELRGFGKVFRDATARKRAEDALKEADRKKDDFIALLAHELRNPLAPIRNGLQVIRLSHDRVTRERSQQMMDRQLGHMVRLIDDLLDVSRINRNKMELRRGRVALSEAVNSGVETARPAIEEAGHELTVSLPFRPVFLDADLTRLSQVVSNLLTNSAKYTERGGRIWLTAQQNEGRVEVSVRDTGIGIPPEALRNIFDMFSQVDRSVERSTGGLGIGLALVKGLVEMHDGTVTAHSEGPGRGSTFIVTLPVLPDQPEPSSPVAADDSGVTDIRHRILVVDDNRDGAESMSEVLRLLGGEVRTAHDGLEAIAAAEEFRPAVILMDVGMPKLNGLDATRRIREHPWGKAITIIALTGWGQENDRERSREAGCDGHLVKPVSLPDLEKLLTELRTIEG
ncbi:MAG TPA: ATP-binding protein, partial [Urbifossiella sp.]|nr:ATP-binding protein [Urbifossiella sp.]